MADPNTIRIATHRRETSETALIAAALGEDSLWRALQRSPYQTPTPCLFLDRDGVLIEERHYLSDPDGVALIPGALAAIAAARTKGHAVVVVSNQAGIGRGHFGWEEFAAVEARMAMLLAVADRPVDAVFACPFHPEGKPPYDRAHPWRKPAPGMLLEAATRLNLDLPRSLLVGDKTSDILAAHAAGLPAALHVRTGHGAREETASLAAATTSFQVIAAEDAGAAVHFIGKE